jgi:HlyD family secretion protein
MRKSILFLSLMIALSSCKNSKNNFDAAGVFEADEVLVSPEVTGRILSLNIEEGMTIDSNFLAASIDTTNVVLQINQLKASINALQEKTNDLLPTIDVLEQQLVVQKQQLASLERDKVRFTNLLQANATTEKKLDDINTQVLVLKDQIEVTKKQIVQQRSLINTQNRGILSERNPLEKKQDQLKDQLSKCSVRNPVAGTVLIKYAEAGEIISAGKPLYKLANISSVNLRAYITGDQLGEVKLGQQVKVMVDAGADKYKEYKGTITWIADKAEFTPKTIQTKDERANLVYATKVKVQNDGFLKLGMYGEVNFK